MPLITDEEIAFIKRNIKQLSWKDIDKKTGVINRELFLLNSGYFVSYTIDTIFDDTNIKMHHVTIKRDINPDPVDMDEIAYRILGRCCIVPSSWNNKNDDTTHYVHFIGVPDNKKTSFYEEGIESGIRFIYENN